MYAIWKREVQNYFLTPIGYVFVTALLFIGGFFFYTGNIMNSSSDLGSTFSGIYYFIMFLVPILTMRVLSEERRNKSDQLLLTSPRSIGQIVLGKFFAACTVFLVCLLFMLFYAVVIINYSPRFFAPRASLLITNYVGFFLLGCCYIAIGVLMSALTENQVSAFVLTIFVNMLLLIMEMVGPQLNIPFIPWLSTVFSWLSMYQRYFSFSAGLLSFADILYFVSFCAIPLFLAVRVIDRRRWSEG